MPDPSSSSSSYALLPTSRDSSSHNRRDSRDSTEEGNGRDGARSYEDGDDGSWEQGRSYGRSGGDGLEGEREKRRGIARGVMLAVGGAVLGAMISYAATSQPTPPSIPTLSPSPPPSVPTRPINPYALPGLILNRPINPALKDPYEPFGIYEKVRWEPMSAFDPPEDALPPPPAVGEAGEVGGVTDRRRAASGIEEDVEKKDSLLEDLKRALNGELEVGEAGIAEWEWARNKTVLAIGDSLIRNNLLYFAKHISQSLQRKMFQYEDPLGHEWKENQWLGSVDVPEIGLKVANWFHNGMNEVEPDIPSFFPGLNLPHNFELKLANVFVPSINHTKGLAGRTPDLIIFESLSWDLVFLNELSGQGRDSRHQGRPLDDIELEWYRGRVIEVLGLVQSTFPSAKIVLQTSHLGSKPEDNVFAPIRKLQQAQAVNSISLETGYPLFDWGRIVSPLSNELEDGLHFRPGAATWIWGEMMLFYLRATSQDPSPVFFNSPAGVNSSPSKQPSGRKRVTQAELLASYKTDEKIKYPIITAGQR